MATFGVPWKDPRWTTIASLLAVAVIGAVLWWLMAKAAPLPQGTQMGDPRLSKQATSDPNVVEWTFRIACFYQARNRLPESLEALRQSGIPDGSAPPATTATGQPLRYERTGDRTYVLTRTYTAADTGQTEEVAMAEEAPAAMPAIGSEALRVWWGIEHEKQMAREMLQGSGGAGAER
jgi:hypothetical protein